MIPVAEIFGPTIQGEGPNTGIKCIFLRVAGCDMHCEWCDSKFAWRIDSNTKKYNPVELSEILIDKCIKSNTSKVIITGGNPCLYDFDLIIDNLIAKNITVDIETQGTIFPSWLNKVNTLVISPKAPSSKQKDVFNNIENFLSTFNKEQTLLIAIKIPVFNDEDFEFSLKYYNLVKEYSKKLNIKLYINVGNSNTKESGDISYRILNNYKKLIDKVLNSPMDNVYIMPQMHTLIWGNKQGV